MHGALCAQVLGHIEPQSFNVLESVTLFVAVIIGGVASVEGSILGAAFVILVPKVLSDFRELVPVVYGLTILLVLIVGARSPPRGVDRRGCFGTCLQPRRRARATVFVEGWGAERG